MNIENAKVGAKVTYSGFSFSIIEICAGALTGMVVIRSRSGTACVSASEVIEEK